MSELENNKPVAFYRADWKGDIMFRKNNTVDVRKNESDFTKGWIKPLYADVAEHSQFTIPKRVAESAERHNKEHYTGAEEFEEVVWEWAYEVIDEYNKPFEKQFEALSDEAYSEAWSKVQIPDEIFAIKEHRLNICRAYLNPITRYLVKVVE